MRHRTGNATNPEDFSCSLGLGNPLLKQSCWRFFIVQSAERHMCPCLSLWCRANTRHTPHYTKLQGQTSANTIHHHDPGCGTLVIYTHHFIPEHVTWQCSWRAFWHIRKSSCNFTSWHRGELLQWQFLKQTHTLPSSKSELNGCYIFQESFCSTEGLPHTTFHSRLTSLFVWSVRVIKFPSGFPSGTLGQQRRDIFVEKPQKRKTSFIKEGLIWSSWDFKFTNGIRS